MTDVRFWCGDRLYQVAPADSGMGFIGVCAGRIVATAPDPAGVARALILSDRWRRTELPNVGYGWWAQPVTAGLSRQANDQPTRQRACDTNDEPRNVSNLSRVQAFAPLERAI
ncbi:MAG: hypothetical protein Q7J13_06740 [Brevundimonas sp.]|uniref:hypothetical protein n=1 Tax=Brevundimonas sp. TaxID=1871086 RepID=UPI0027198957|nr:hypothetical protein [Brevundimonas sp.]MDO9587615.1 hypothetical protein [Brevundimonas sp.]